MQTPLLLRQALSALVLSLAVAGLQACGGGDKCHLVVDKLAACELAQDSSSEAADAVKNMADAQLAACQAGYAKADGPCREASTKVFECVNARSCDEPANFDKDDTVCKTERDAANKACPAQDSSTSSKFSVFGSGR